MNARKVPRKTGSWPKKNAGRDKRKIFTMNQRAIDFVKAFVAGFVSTLVFHQGLFTLFYLAAVVPRAPYDLRAVPPLAIPAVISLAFWGGVWGVAIWPFLNNVNGPAYWVRALVISAIASGSVTLFIVFPLKGMPMGPRVIVSTLMLNGTWGLGMALLIRLMRASHATHSQLSVSIPRRKVNT
jgi:hypothetical protein